MKPEVSQEQVPVELLLPFLQEMLKDGKTIKMTVTGNSMMPLLRDRKDSVHLASPESLKKYDIVLYTNQRGEVILHRIVKKTKAGYMIVGDNQIGLDGPIDDPQITAKVVGFDRDGKYFSCRLWWCRFYAFIWARVRPFRRQLLPILYAGGKIMKRIVMGEAK